MNIISLDLELFKLVLEQEAKRLVGKCMKRFELTDDKEAIKANVKEIIYEEFRSIIDILQTGKILFVNQNEYKKGDKNG